jgi:hypothetical protein
VPAILDAIAEKKSRVTGRRNLSGDVNLGVEFRVHVLGKMVRSTISSPSTHELGVTILERHALVAEHGDFEGALGVHSATPLVLCLPGIGYMLYAAKKIVDLE